MIKRALARFGLSVGLIAGLVGLGGPALAATTVSGDPDAAVKTEVNDDLFTAGQSVSVAAPIKGELFAAGQTVTVTNRPDRSVFVAGQTVSLPSGAGYNAFVGGQTVTLAGEYGHDVYALGETIVLDPGAHIRGSLYALGSTISIHGTVDGTVSVSGESVTSDAAIGHGATIESSSISFSGGSIGGDLRYNRDARTNGLDQVTVSGSTTATDPATSDRTDGQRAGSVADVLQALMAFVTLVVMGGLFILLTPARVTAMTEAVTGRWVSSFLTGLVVLVVAPLLVGLSVATVIGWPVALIIGLLVVATLVTSSFLAPIVLGSLILRDEKPGRPWRPLLLGSLIVAVTTALPLIGWLPATAVFVGLTLPLFGASVRWVWEMLTAPPAR